jgi:molybdopterin-guanine dinucleotide biosynthesis protein A
MTTRATRAAVTRAYLLVGRARRLPGKFLLPMGGMPILGRARDAVLSAGLDVVAVCVSPVDLPGLTILPDRYDAGPLGGLETVLEHTREPFFLFGGDMPFLDPGAIRTMVEAFDGRTLVPLNSEGRREVLHAVYSKVDPGRVSRLLEKGAGLTELVAELSSEGRVRFLAGGALPESSFLDVDTAEDYARLSRRAATARDSP